MILSNPSHYLDALEAEFEGLPKISDSAKGILCAHENIGRDRGRRDEAVRGFFWGAGVILVFEFIMGVVL